MQVEVPESALKLCRSVLTAGKNGSAMGPGFLLSCVQSSKKKNLGSFDVKLACALHLITRYRLIKQLVNAPRDYAVKKFRGREYIYLNPLKVGLFKVCNTNRKLFPVKKSTSQKKQCTAVCTTYIISSFRSLITRQQRTGKN